jgi:hypothetical protein
VTRRQLPQANARLSGTVTVANYFVGKPLGGSLFALAAALPFLLGAGWLAAAATLVLALRGSSRHGQSGRLVPATLRADIAEGMRWLWCHRLLRAVAATLAVLNVTFVAWNAILVLFAREQLALGPAGFGYLLTAHAAGAVLGSLVAGRIITPTVLALTRAAPVAGAALAVFGFHALVWGAVLTSLRQELTPPQLRGRVESVYRLLEYGGAVPGALLGGLLAARLGLAAPFWFAVITGIVVIPFAWPLFSATALAEARSERDKGRQ